MALTSASSFSDCVGPSHSVALVRSLPGVVNFTLNKELPLPLKRLLGPQLDWVDKVTHFCSTPLHVYNTQRRWVGGVERWSLHCHCPHPYGLKCLAATMVVVQIIKKMFYGCGYNNKFLLYRELVNYRVSNGLGLVGTLVVGQMHLIYIKVGMPVMYESLRKHLYLGNHVSCPGCYAFYIIIICSDCARASGTDVERCARRTRRLLERCYATLREVSPLRLYSSEEAERHRRQQLRRFAWYHLPIDTASLKWVSF